MANDYITIFVFADETQLQRAVAGSNDLRKKAEREEDEVKILEYILVAELEILPHVCQNAWKSGVGYSPQSVRELRQCVQAAVSVTKRRICLFVDDLDELQPESDHNDVVGFL